MLRCSKCSEWKEKEKFHSYNKCWCKECVREYNRNYQRCWYKKSENRKKRTIYYREWYKKYGRKRASNYVDMARLWKKNNLEKVHVNKLVYCAIRAGKLKRPNICVRCKEKRKVVGHHKDYEYPFKITWLCYSCHKKTPH